MKLGVSEDREVEVIGGGKEVAFKIAQNAKIFHMLSSQVYTDKIKAIIRELSTNAVDAHIYKKTPNRPFNIQLPTSLDPTFVVRDYGPGLSQKDITELYTTYGASTKSDSNDYIGAFGIGAKAPFSYTDTFTIVSWFEGKKSVYTAYIGEDDKPYLRKLSSENSNEESGVSIMIPVHFSDINEFYAKANVVLDVFNPFPNVVPEGRVKPVQYIIKKNSWGIRSSHDRTVRIIQGNVSYQVPFMNFPKPVDIIVPIGTFEPSLSREQITLDKGGKTEKKIKDLFAEIQIELEQELTKEIDSCTTFIDAWEKFWEIKRSFNIKDRIWKNISLNDPGLNCELIFSSPYRIKQNDTWEHWQSCLYWLTPDKLKTSTLIHVDDLNDWKKYHWRWACKSNFTHNRFIYLKGDISLLTGLHIKSIKDFQDRSKSTAVRTTPLPPTFKIFNDYNFSTIKSIPTEGYYVFLDHDKPEIDKNACKYLLHYSKHIEKNEVILYGVPLTHKRKMKKSPLIHIDVLKKRYDDWVNSPEIQKEIEIANKIFTSIYGRLNKNFLDAQKINASSPLYEVLYQMHKTMEARKYLNKYGVGYNPNSVEIEDWAHKIQKTYSIFFSLNHWDSVATEALEALDKSRGVVYYP